MAIEFDIDDEAMLELLRSSHARVKASRVMSAELMESIIRTQDLVRESFALLNEGGDSAILNFYKTSENSPQDF